MLEPNETGATAGNHNEDNTSPSDTLPPRRRRRAASRPAGPPVTAGAGDTPAGEVVVEAPAAEVADVASLAEAPNEAAEPAPAP
ncbi:hypothetical protein ACPB9J_03845, partial [Streptomyces lavendulocolor]|uniref:hypothetical protein n=1 Tax=Streptomyces lavendulocolor TaxID=67316 RepID=UPI003C2D07BB